MKFGELRSEIAGLLRQTSNGLLEAEIKRAINDAIDYHSTRRFDFTDGFERITTTDGTADYPLPDDFLAVSHARIDWGGANFTVMKKRTWGWYLQVSQDASQLRSTPSSDYALRGQRIYLYPTPSSSFGLDLYYIRRLLPAPLVNDDDENEWTTQARLLIRSRALYDLYLNKAQQPDHAQAQLQFEQDAMDLLTRPAALNLGSQELVPWGF